MLDSQKQGPGRTYKGGEGIVTGQESKCSGDKDRDAQGKRVG